MESDALEMDEATRKELEMLQEEDAEFLNGIDDLPTDEESESELESINDEVSDSDSDDMERAKVMENTARNQRLGQSRCTKEIITQTSTRDDDGKCDEAPVDLKDEVRLQEDIYGRVVIKSIDRGQKDGNAYLAPHLRREKSSTDDNAENRELIRKINGQLNRISESNLE